MLKKFLSGLLCVSMLLSLCSVSVFGAEVGSFEDVKEDDYFAEAVEWAVENGITKGTSETTFSPNDTCTRGQIVTFLYRAYANK